ncbi:MAG: UDP-N-acetylmuramoyl-L-alanyl-D-glutamate--2,6-diaminopimelate ligase [Pseudomonadales bacterium]|nr:UDP-N-acetylmuramoyl-L-alanyl-D-glutamate--2,6-diaminopimelate ligase [Pseudomonadales bacterium]
MLEPSTVHSQKLAALLPMHSLKSEEANIVVAGLQNDSRKIDSGDLFFALSGTLTDGSRYIEEAIQKGAYAVLIDSKGVQPEMEVLSIPVIAVDNLTRQVGEIVGRFYGEPSKSLNIIAITGTNGKTSCGRIIAELAEQLDQKCMVIGTTGYGFSDHLTSASHTTPDAIDIQKMLAWGLEQNASMVSMEVSSHGLEQERLSGIQVNTALFTNLTRDHLDYHGSMKSYGDAKRKLFDLPGLSHAVINFDDSFGRNLLANMPSSVRSYSYSLDSAAADLYAEKIDAGSGVCADIKTPWGDGQIKSTLLGDFNLSNLLAATAALCISGLTLEKVLLGIETLTPVEGRMEPFGGELQPNVIIDFAHTPDALEKALTQLKQVCDGKLICVFGCGGDRDNGKRAMMGSIADSLCDHLILTDDNPRSENPKDITDQIADGFKGFASHEVIHDRYHAIEHAINGAGPQDYILIAGKGHEQTQEYASSSNHFCDREVVSKILNGSVNCDE